MVGIGNSIRAVAVLAVLAMVAPAHSQPVPSALAQLGSFPDIPGAVNRPDPTLDYKIVFDAVSGPKNGEIHPVLVNVTRILNTFSQHGVPAKKRKWVVVLRGPATATVMTDQAFAMRTGAKANPNTAVIKALMTEGVSFHVCGLAARDLNITADMIVPEATVDLHGTVSLINFQTRGYVLIGER